MSVDAVTAVVTVWTRIEAMMLWKFDEIHFRVFTVAILLSWPGTSAQAQDTIPEAVVLAHGRIASEINVSIGLVPSLDDVLKGTDVVVRGQIGEPRAYLSRDQKRVWSDYRLINPIFLFHAVPAATRTPGLATADLTNATTITLRGGTINVSGYSFTESVHQLPPFTPGTDGVFLLKRDGDHYQLASIFGALEVVDGRLKPLTTFTGFAPEIEQLSTAAAIREIVQRAALIHSSR
jgi:hypothetical protein